MICMGSAAYGGGVKSQTPAHILLTSLPSSHKINSVVKQTYNRQLPQDITISNFHFQSVKNEYKFKQTPCHGHGEVNDPEHLLKLLIVIQRGFIYRGA